MMAKQGGVGGREGGGVRAFTTRENEGGKFGRRKEERVHYDKTTWKERKRGKLVLRDWRRR